MVTYGVILLAAVLHLNIRLAVLAKDLEGDMVQVGLCLKISKLVTDKTFGIENAGKMSIGNILCLNGKREKWKSEKSTTMAHLPHSLLLKI